jgi:putative FmdB family regulatory protein
MPTYGYHCTACTHKCDVFQKITEEPLTKCPACQKESLKRGPGGGIGLSFSNGGQGFYINDYASASPAPKTEGCCPCGKNQGSCKT